MIGMAEEAQLRTVTKLEDLHGILIGLYGRVLRVQSLSREIDYGGLFGYYDERYDGPSTVNWTKFDRIGRLSGLELDKHTSQAEDSADSTSSPYLRIRLEGSADTIALELRGSHIEVLQEDTGAWTTVQRPADWQERNEEAGTAS